ncbi:nitronate monooxygenase [Paractinoplanes brasiliensis]|uniref:Propionate 3-nitronate monooxygenase n=1 Tax=Paractinoplanes brasiliensis TaxID=52695 RepID=A0A4R6J9Q9_9ACTN|nr:nitronate monooxygenase [Actinoplanes brasiliensis]TDO32393.1 nitroalkane oxidase [Actinoplanes brasiliensis]GID27739.1 oxidoreductase [Actinoplanes brasiliensis]
MLRPIVVAPMAGGPSTPALVNAATAAGATGFLAAGYKTPLQVSEELRAVHGSYGLNIFVPGPPPPSVEAVHDYRVLLQAEADRYGVSLPPLRLADDDHFAAKVSLAVTYGVPFVSFTFGVPPREVVAALQSAGSQVLITVTSPSEAVSALAVSPDALIVQGGSAGGHSATLTPASYSGDVSTVEVLTAVRQAIEPLSTTTPTNTPAAGVPAADGPADVLTAGSTTAAQPLTVAVVAAGGVADRSDVERLLAAGATAVQCGTAFLLADEAGTRPAQRDFMLSARATGTVVTRAFTGRPARALRNRFTDTYTEAAPIGYPAVHHLTAPLRAAAARAADPDGLNLWAGTGFRSARPGPLADLIARLHP